MPAVASILDQLAGTAAGTPRWTGTAWVYEDVPTRDEVDDAIAAGVASIDLTPYVDKTTAQQIGGFKGFVDGLSAGVVVTPFINQYFDYANHSFVQSNNKGWRHTLNGDSTLLLQRTGNNVDWTTAATFDGDTGAATFSNLVTAASFTSTGTVLASGDITTYTNLVAAGRVQANYGVNFGDAVVTIPRLRPTAPNVLTLDDASGSSTPTELIVGKLTSTGDLRLDALLDFGDGAARMYRGGTGTTANLVNQLGGTGGVWTWYDATGSGSRMTLPQDGGPLTVPGGVIASELQAYNGSRVGYVGDGNNYLNNATIFRNSANSNQVVIDGAAGTGTFTGTATVAGLTVDATPGGYAGIAIGKTGSASVSNVKHYRTHLNDDFTLQDQSFDGSTYWAYTIFQHGQSPQFPHGLATPAGTFVIAHNIAAPAGQPLLLYSDLSGGGYGVTLPVDRLTAAGITSNYDVSAAGTVDTGSWFSVDGVQVVGNQGAAVADATDAASAVTQLNLLLARVRAGTGHGLIAA